MTFLKAIPPRTRKRTGKDDSIFSGLNLEYRNSRFVGLIVHS